MEKIAPAAIPSRARKTSNLLRGLSAILIQTPLENGKRHRGKSFFARLMVSEPSPEHPPAPERDELDKSKRVPFPLFSLSKRDKREKSSLTNSNLSKKKKVKSKTRSRRPRATKPKPYLRNTRIPTLLYSPKTSFRLRSRASPARKSGRLELNFLTQNKIPPVPRGGGALHKKRKNNFNHQSRTFKPFGNPGRVLRTNVITSAPPMAIADRAGISLFFCVFLFLSCCVCIKKETHEEKNEDEMRETGFDDDEDGCFI